MNCLKTFCLLILLSGCSSLFKEKVVVETRTVTIEPFHPAKPTPLHLALPDVSLLTPTTRENVLSDDQNYTYIVYSWEQYLVLAQSFEQMLTKLEEYNLLLCHYRRSLAEPECKGKVAAEATTIIDASTASVGEPVSKND